RTPAWIETWRVFFRCSTARETAPSARLRGSKGPTASPASFPPRGTTSRPRRSSPRPSPPHGAGAGNPAPSWRTFPPPSSCFKGQGRGSSLPKHEVITSNGAPLGSKGAHSDSFVVDWDGDGSLDLISGSSDGGIYWAKNKAPKGKMPDLLPFQPLIKPGPAVKY